MKLKIIDDDAGNIEVRTDRGLVATWLYLNRESQGNQMKMARGFAEGWFQAVRAIEGNAK